MKISKRLLVALVVPGFLLGGIVGQAAVAGALTNNAVLMNGVPCTVTLNGLSYGGNCSGGFVEASASPTPPPPPTPAPNPPPPPPAPAPAPGARGKLRDRPGLQGLPHDAGGVRTLPAERQPRR